MNGFVNENIRRIARSEGIPLHAIAREIGISEPTITRWLRVPLLPEREKLILGAIQRISNNEVIGNGDS